VAWEYKELTFHHLPNSKVEPGTRAELAVKMTYNKLLLEHLQSEGQDGWQADCDTDFDAMVSGGHIFTREHGWGLITNTKLTYDRVQLRLKRLKREEQSRPASPLSDGPDDGSLPSSGGYVPRSIEDRMHRIILAVNEFAPNFKYQSVWALSDPGNARWLLVFVSPAEFDIADPKIVSRIRPLCQGSAGEMLILFNFLDPDDGHLLPLRGAFPIG